MTDKYKLRYKIEIDHQPEGYMPEDASDEHGLTDALVAVSMLYPEDGSYSQQIILAADGRTGKLLPNKDIFKMWLTMGLGLADLQHEDLPNQFLSHFAEAVRMAFK